MGLSIHPAIILFIISIVIAAIQFIPQCFDMASTSVESVKETIFVVLVIPPETDLHICNPCKLIDYAKHKSRVTIGIHDFTGDFHSPQKYQNNFKVKHCQFSKYFRYCSARADVVNEMYVEEMYIPFVPHDCSFDRNWDEQLIGMFQHVSNPSSTVITGMCNKESATKKSQLPHFLCLKHQQKASLTLASRELADYPQKECSQYILVLQL